LRNGIFFIPSAPSARVNSSRLTVRGFGTSSVSASVSFAVCVGSVL
jgi:hypothetical protein